MERMRRIKFLSDSLFQRLGPESNCGKPVNNGTEIKSLADLKQDQHNARKHNPRNIGMITKSIQDVGVSRSGVIDEDGNILAGNGTYEALSELGIEKVKVVKANGNEWVVVQRDGLSEEDKIKLSLGDNRSAELAEWDPDVIKDINLTFPDMLEGMFSESHLEDILESTEEALEKQEVLLDQAVQMKPQREYLVVICEDEDEFIELREKLKMGSVRRGGYKKGSEFDAIGQERVIPAAKVLERMNEDSDSK